MSQLELGGVRTCATCKQPCCSFSQYNGEYYCARHNPDPIDEDWREFFIDLETHMLLELLLPPDMTKIQ